jgi:hypothetical protein
MKQRRLLDEVDHREGESLSAALFTTFDPSDYRLLADRVLPALFGLLPAPAENAAEFARARSTLCEALSRLRGKLVVVSSSRPCAGHWLTSYVRFRRTDAVQHAKLWMFLWRDRKEVERLEIIVSSANLTANGFDEQIQSAWRINVKLGPVGNDNSKSWSDLPRFLDELSASCKSDGEIALFADLLHRARCPKGIQFVATTPTEGMGTASLKRALGALEPIEMRVLSPYTGAWTPAALDEWLRKAGCTGATVIIAAVPTASSLPEARQWILPQKTRDALWKRASFGLLSEKLAKSLRGDVSPDADKRWTHAKLYEFRYRHGKKRALLVTSANFTSNAWAADGTGNFELGVLLQSQGLPFAFECAKDRNQVQVRGEPKMEALGIWADATWDGEVVTIRARRKEPPSISLDPPATSAPAKPIVLFKDGLIEARVNRRVPAPRVATLQFFDTLTSVPVLDVRANADDLPFGELDEGAAQEWKDRLLLERYRFDFEMAARRPKKAHVKRSITLTMVYRCLSYHANGSDA